MKTLSLVLLFAATMSLAGGQPQTFTGTITDSMCVADHAIMHVTPDAKCVRECAKSGSSVKYVLYDGKNVYKLSDQQTPGHPEAHGSPLNHDHRALRPRFARQLCRRDRLAERVCNRFCNKAWKNGYGRR